MPFSISQAARSAVFNRLAPGNTKFVDQLSVGVGMLNEKYELEFGNRCLHDLLPQAAEASGRDFFSLGSIDPQLRACICSELNLTGRWQGLLHHGRILRVELQRQAPAEETVGYTLVVIDFTREYRQLSELSAAKLLAERTDRAKSQFLSHMSHELRTPLNAILGFTQLMLINDELNELQQDNLKEIESAGNYLLSLINEILDLSRIEAGKIQLSEETISMDQLLRECVAIARPLGEARHIGINYELHTGRLLQSDHVRLKQVLLNLISNAVKYNADGGSVSVHCFEHNDDSIHIEVRDTGPGIAAGLQNNIFSPFERLGAEDQKIEGTGIGLMITRRLVQLMGGRIGLVSEPGRGSVFWIRLPSLPASLNDMLSPDGRLVRRDRPNRSAARICCCIGLRGPWQDLLERVAELRPDIELLGFDAIHEAMSPLLQHRPECIFLSTGAAHELALDSRNLLALKNMNLVVVETDSKPASTQVDPALFRQVLPARHTLHELLTLVDAMHPEN